jgi:hypothetical protein
VQIKKRVFFAGEISFRSKRGNISARGIVIENIKKLGIRSLAKIARKDL